MSYIQHILGRLTPEQQKAIGGMDNLLYAFGLIDEMDFNNSVFYWALVGYWSKHGSGSGMVDK